MQLNSTPPEKNNQWLKKAIFFLVLMLLAIFIFYSLRAYKNYQKMAKLYIDGNYKGWIQLGSEKHPYGEVSKAFEAAQKKIKLPDIYLKNGEYTENFEIPENMKIYGESRDGVVIKNNDPLSISTITLKNNAALANITIIGGHTGILAEGQANIENCSVREFEKTGIDAISNESEIIIKNSEIGNSKGKGLYAQRGRKIYFADNEVHNNKEEGLDLRQVVSGEISNNKIYDNEEDRKSVV